MEEDMTRPRILALVAFLSALALVVLWMPAFAPGTDGSVTKQETQNVSPIPCGAAFDSAEGFVIPHQDACSASESPAVFLAAKPGRLGYCKCGCGARCHTSADCGGAACIAFITCC
jgi:hypothetical protein